MDLELSAEALGRSSYAFAPLAEVAASARLLLSRRSAPIGQGWVEVTRRRVGESTELAAVMAIVPPPPHHRVPMFLVDVAASAHPLDAALARIETLDPDDLRDQVGVAWNHAVPLPVSRQLAGHDIPRRLAGALAVYWALVLEPLWPRMRVVLEDEVARRATTAAHGGVWSMFDGVHPTVSLDGNRLLVNKPHVDRTCMVERIILMPSVFVWPHVGVFEASPARFTISYAARGFAQVFEEGRPEPGAELGKLIGATRAALLHVLELPTTTLDAARQLHHSPATVSRHLTVLRASGLASARRQGREVYYRRTELGDALCAGGSAIWR